jgi:hypothetical protein
MHANLRHRNNWPLVPAFDQQTLSLRKKVEGIHCRIRGFHHRSQEGEQLAAQPLNAIGIEQSRCKNDLRVQATAGMAPQDELQVKPRDISPPIQTLNLQTFQPL